MAVSILVIAYGIVIAGYGEIARAAKEKALEMKDELRDVYASSLISAMCSFGYPFEYTGNLPAADLHTICRARFVPGMGYEFETCRRWK